MLRDEQKLITLSPTDAGEDAVANCGGALILYCGTVHRKLFALEYHGPEPFKLKTVVKLAAI